jgi:hypothetical protein
MKKTITIILSIIITTLSFGQIDKNMMQSNWNLGKEKVIYGNTVFRHEGKNGTSGQTNIGYQSFGQVKAEFEKDAEKEMWTEEKKNETIDSYSRFASGGLIHLYLTRLTIDAANTEMFTVIVKDSIETEIFREVLKSKIPNIPSRGTDYWWNYTSIPINKNIKGKIYIYIIDRLGNDNSKFKFEMKL